MINASTRDGCGIFPLDLRDIKVKEAGDVLYHVLGLISLHLLLLRRQLNRLSMIVRRVVLLIASTSNPRLPRVVNLPIECSWLMVRTVARLSRQLAEVEAGLLLA
jgi:hypothetical protein